MTHLKIMMAEDNLVNQKIASLLFNKLGVEPVIVHNGSEAVNMAVTSDFDLIFMDVHMPEMNGLEATRELRSQLGDSCPYIIALTAADMEHEKHEYMSAGMDDFLGKPLNIKGINEVVQRFNDRKLSNT